MKIIYQERRKFSLIPWLLSVLLILPFFTACSGQRDTYPPPVDRTRVDNTTTTRTSQNAPARAPEAKKPGLSTGQKVAITLAGAAALYYLYNQHKNKQQEGAEGKYYLSKNGGVYYRDAQKQVHWVKPPAEGIKVPPEEAERYRDFQGYNNSPTGRDLAGLGRDPVPAQ
jgi:hypothetical protein